MSVPPLDPGPWIAPADDIAQARRVRYLLAGSRAAALVVAGVGALALAGWHFDIVALRQLRADQGAMAPATAVALMLAGSALWLLHPRNDGTWRGRVAQAMSWLILAISATTLSQYLLGIDLGIDQAIYRDPGHAVQTAHPGRMSLAAALAFGMLGAALLLLPGVSRTAQKVARLLALMASTMLLVGMLGFLYGKESLYAVPIFRGVAVHTLAALLLLAAGIIAIQPARGFATMLISGGAGGRLARNLLPYAVAAPLLLGWLRPIGERAGLYPMAMGIDLMVVTMVVLLVALIWWNARLLDKAHAKAQRAQAAMRDYAAQVQDLYDCAPCGYHSLDADGLIVRINDTELQWLGYRREEVVGKLRFQDMLTPASRQVFQDAFLRFKTEGQVKDIEYDVYRKDGSVLPVSLSASLLLDDAGGYAMSRATMFDITQRRSTEQALRRSEESARLRLAEIEQIYRYAPVGLCNFDRQYRFLRINERMADLNGIPAQAHIGRTMWEMVPDLAPQLVDIFRPIYERGEAVLDIEIRGRTARDPENDHYWLASYFPVRSSSEEVIGIIAAVLDITERKRIEQSLRESEAAVRAMALTDPLTGLGNRRRLDEALRTEIHRADRYGGRMAVVIADLDHFKRVNDQHGHAVGDGLLREFARIIRTHCRETDLVARFGGEEFVVLMPEAGASEALSSAERIRSELARTILPPLLQPVTASFGVAERAPGESEGSLLRRADNALYRGKAAGRNCVQLADAPACESA